MFWKVLILKEEWICLEGLQDPFLKLTPKRNALAIKFDYPCPGVALALKIGGQNGNFFQCTYSKTMEVYGKMWPPKQHWMLILCTKTKICAP